MALMDIFRPKWKNSDQEVRKAAIEQLTDQAILAEIAKTDKECAVCQVAVKRLTDQALLAEIVKTNKKSEVREAAVEKISDQALLAEIARTDRDMYVCVKALQRMTDQALIIEIAKKYRAEELQEKVVSLVSDKSLLSSIALGSMSGRARLAAADKLADQAAAQAAYADIAKNVFGGDFDVRPAATDKITDRAILNDLAKTASDIEVRWRALLKLNDQEAFALAIKNDKDARLRLAILEKLREQTALADVAKNDTSWLNRGVAASLLKDQALAQAVFLELATKSDIWHIRRDAAKKLTDKSVLAEITKNDNNQEVRHAAVSRLSELAPLADVDQGQARINVDRPICSGCSLELKSTGSMFGSGQVVILGGGSTEQAQDDYTQFAGSLCFQCRKVFCPTCLGEQVDRCPVCRGEVMPAFKSALRKLSGL